RVIRAGFRRSIPLPGVGGRLKARGKLVPLPLFREPSREGGRPMLVLSRNVGQGVVIGADVGVQVLQAGRRGVRLGVNAPAAVPSRRADLPAGRRPEPAPLGPAAGPKGG